MQYMDIILRVIVNLNRKRGQENTEDTKENAEAQVSGSVLAQVKIRPEHCFVS